MAGGETLQPAASKEGFRALRVSVDLEIAKGLTDLFPTLEDPGALVSNACALQLEADEVTTDFGSPLPFVVFVRSDGSSNPPSNISVEPIPGRHRYRLGITLDDKHLRTTVFGAAQIGKATIISQGSLKPQPYITLGEQERGERVLLLAQHPDYPESISIGQLEDMPNGWRSVFINNAKAVQRADGIDSEQEVKPAARGNFGGFTNAVQSASPAKPNIRRFYHDEVPRIYRGATPVVSHADSPDKKVTYTRDKRGKVVVVPQRRGEDRERQGRRGRSNPLGGMTVATPQTFTRIAEQPRGESTSVLAEKTSGAKTGEQKRPKGRFERRAQRRAKLKAQRRANKKGGKK